MLSGFGLVDREPAEITPLGLVCCSPCVLLKVHGDEFGDGHAHVGMESTCGLKTVVKTQQKMYCVSFGVGC